MSRAVEALSALVAEHGSDLPLAEALLAAALEERPTLQAGPYLARLDDLAGRARSLVGRVGTLAAMRQALFEEAGFAGNTEAYYDPRNSQLDEVIDRGLGQPITLSAVYLEVARRAGEVAEGIGFPGHFLVAHHVAGRPVYVDAFDEGQVLGPDALAAHLARAAGGPAEVEPWMLEPASGLAIVLRVLTNLNRAYVLAEDLPGAITALDRMLALEPDLPEARRDRGMLYAQLRLPQAALPDIEAYVQARPTAEDTPKLLAMMPSLEAARGQLD